MHERRVRGVEPREDKERDVEDEGEDEQPERDGRAAGLHPPRLVRITVDQSAPPSDGPTILTLCVPAGIRASSGQPVVGSHRAR